MVKFNIVSVVICLGVVSVSEGHEKSWSETSSSMSSKKFGCQFDSDEYFVKAKFKPVYGEQVESMEFTNIMEFEPIWAGIKALYSELMEELAYTNILDFYNFYDAYKHHWQRFKREDRSVYSLLGFYNDYYKPSFVPRHGDASMAVELLDRLTQRYPEIAGSVHLVTSSVNAKKTSWIEEMNTHQFFQNYSMEEPRSTFVHNHVAALLRIRVGEKFGFLLMDPANGMTEPYMSLENEQDQKSPSRSYVVEKNRVNGGPTFDVYYIAKPFCSFLMTTTKRNILDTSLQIVRRNKKGDIEASIMFDLTALEPVFHMHGHGRNLTVNFRAPLSTDQSLENEIIEAVNYPGIPDILSKAKTITKNTPFLREYKDLVRDYNSKLY